MTRLGYQIPNFTYDGVGPAELFDVVAAQAKAADQAGFDTVFVMDHFYQLPLLGAPENYMMECYTTLGALARETSNVRLGALVTGNTYRNPTLLAKSVTALDVVSGGRAQLGIGAGWFEEEHNSLGYEFGTFTTRFERLEEALQIILPMLGDERPTFKGEYYQVNNAINQPPPVGRIPVMIGGGGEKKTLRMVAQYGDESNLTSPPDEIPRKLEALAGHCERLGRDRSEITMSQHLNVLLAKDHDSAQTLLRSYLGSRGVDLDAMDEATRAFVLGRIVAGGPDEVGERVAAVIASGVDGVTCSMPGNGQELEPIHAFAELVKPILGLT
jgi:F420-dependent oxidoreductase-like protein